MKDVIQPPPPAGFQSSPATLRYQQDMEGRKRKRLGLWPHFLLTHCVLPWLMVRGYSSAKWPLSRSLPLLPLQAKSHSFLLPRRDAQMLHHPLLFLLHLPLPLQSNCPQLSLFGCVDLPQLTFPS